MSEDFSVTRFFSLFTAATARINQFPLTSDNLVIQQDAYKRLGEDDEASEIFASLACERKEKDTDLRFAVEFLSFGFVLHIEHLDVLAFAFEDFKNEAAAAKQLVTIITMLASGQLGVLVSSFRGDVCATEFVLYSKPSPEPAVLATDGYYRRFKNYDRDAYDYFLAHNNYEFKRHDVPVDFCLIRTDDGGQPLKMGRKLTGGLSPLTKQQHDFTIGELALQRAGKRPEQSMFGLLYRSWEFWLGIAAISGMFYLAQTLHLLPQVIGDHPVVLQVPGWLFIYAVCIRLLSYKEQLKLRDPDHPYVRLDARLHRKPKTSKTVSVAEPKPARADRWLFVQTTVGLIAAICLYLSGQQFHQALHPDWLDRGTPALFQIVFSAAAGLLVLFVGLVFAGKLRLKPYNYLSDITVFLVIAFIIFTVNDRTNNMAAAPWLLFFAAFFGVIGVNGLGEFMINRATAARLRRDI